MGQNIFEKSTGVNMSRQGGSDEVSEETQAFLAAQQARIKKEGTEQARRTAAAISADAARRKNSHIKSQKLGTEAHLSTNPDAITGMSSADRQTLKNLQKNQERHPTVLGAQAIDDHIRNS